MWQNVVTTWDNTMDNTMEQNNTIKRDMEKIFVEEYDHVATSYIKLGSGQLSKVLTVE